MKKTVWVWLLLLCPGWAAALDMEFYTYNAFEETVAAFQRVALVLQDPSFTVFVGVFAIVGVLVGGLMVGAKGMQGGQVNPISFLIPVMVGIALFRGFVWPTGTLHVYDPVRNATQAVGDVPDAVILMAGALNKIERGVSEIVQGASADPAAERSGALRYSLILNALNARGADLSLERNLVNYYLDCGLPSMSLNFNGASQREAERSTEDLYTTFARFAHPTFATYAYTGDGDATTTMTCQTIWSDLLNPKLNGTGALSDVRDVICAKTGFDMATATQVARCDEELQQLGSLYGVTLTSSLPFLRSTQLSLAMTNAMRSGDISVQTGALVNRQVMAEGMGVAESLDRWVPKVRGFMTAAVLGMVPLVLLFAVTPLLGKALQLLAGLFLWLTLWGIADSISVSMAADAAADSFEQMSRYGLSHMSFMLSPEGAIQSLGVFGKARAMALMMATVVSYAIFQFGGYAFTSMANSWQNDVQQMGESAGRTALHPEERAAMMQRMSTSPATEATLGQYGFANVAAGATMGAAQQAREAQRVSSSFIPSTLNGPPGSGPSQGERPGAPTMGEIGGTSFDDARAAALGMQSRSEPARGSGDGPAMGKVPGVSGEFRASGASTESDPMQEVVVTGYERELEKSRDMFDYVDAKADIGIASTMGTIDARASIADRRHGDSFVLSKEAARFGDEQSVTASLVENETLNELGHDAQLSGTREGLGRAGRTVARTQLSENVSQQLNETRDSAETALGVAQQESGTLLAATLEGSPGRFIEANRQQLRRSFAEAEQLERDNTAEVAGRADAIRAGVQGVATERTQSNFGRQAMIEGAELSQSREAAMGSEVAASEGIAGFSADQADLTYHRQRAEIDVQHQLGDAVGIDAGTDEGMGALQEARERANQTLVVSGNSKERAVELLQSDERTAEVLREHPSARMSISLDEDGGVAMVSLSAGREATVVEETSVRRGFTDTTTFSETIGGGRALVLDAEALSDQLDRVYGDGLINGQYDETRMTALSNGIARYVTESGQSIDASSRESKSYLMNGGVGAGWGGGSKSASGETKGPVKASGSVSVDKQESDTRNAGVDLSVYYAREAITEAHKQALAGFRQDHGVDASETDREEVLSRMAGSIQRTMSALSDDIADETEGAREGHDVDPFPHNNLPPAPMSDPEYARRAPINQR